MNWYQSKHTLLPGSAYEEVLRRARYEFQIIQKRNPRRQAYVRSRYFKRDKVFLSLFWDHLMQKRLNDRLRRLKYYRCAIDTITHSMAQPSIVIEKGDLLYRFYGRSAEGQTYCVQVKMSKRGGRKDLLSVFPLDN